MTWDCWWWFFVTEIVLSFVPGPAVLFVIAQGLRYGAWRSLAASIGILLANSVYFFLSALGLGALLLAVPCLLTTLRWLGAGYVAWLGLAALRSRGAIAVSPSDSDAGLGRALLRRGFLLQLANPKALLFFASILPGFVDTQRAGAWPAWLQILVLGATSVLTEIWVLFGYGALAAAASARVQEPRFLQWLDRFAGIVLLAVAVWLGLRA